MTNLNNLSQRIEAIVRKELIGTKLENALMHWNAIQDNQQMVMFNLMIHVPEIDCISDLKEIVEKVETFCCNDDPPTVVDGKEWYIGDGDDDGAVSFAHGFIRIWVRHWPNGQ